MFDSIDERVLVRPNIPEDELQMKLELLGHLTAKNSKLTGVGVEQFTTPIRFPRRKDRKKIYDNCSKTFENGWTINYTDNLNYISTPEIEEGLLLIHGLPGSPLDFYNLKNHLGSFCRIIGYYIAGFDGQENEE